MVKGNSDSFTPFLKEHLVEIHFRSSDFFYGQSWALFSHLLRYNWAQVLLCMPLKGSILLFYMFFFEDSILWLITVIVHMGPSSLLISNLNLSITSFQSATLESSGKRHSLCFQGYLDIPSKGTWPLLLSLFSVSLINWTFEKRIARYLKHIELLRWLFSIPFPRPSKLFKCGPEHQIWRQYQYLACENKLDASVFFNNLFSV